MTMSFRGIAAALACYGLAGCSYLHDTFSQTVDVGTNERIHTAVPVGTPMVTAEARLSAKGFDCEQRTGNFTDETGEQRNAPHFLSCVQRPAKISFACENRNQVVVVPNDGVADEIDVLRGPSCDQNPGPSLIAPNAAR